jgi:hypothetical protein
VKANRVCEYPCVAKRPKLERPALVRWMLIVLALGLVGSGAAIGVWWLGLGGSSQHPGRAPATVTATVVSAASCAVPSARDQVELHLEGQTRKAHLDGCGHQQGEQVQVQAPDKTQTSADLVVRLPGTGSGAANTGFGSRLWPMLLTVAGIGGAAYALVIRPISLPARGPARRGTADGKPGKRRGRQL